MAVDPLWLCATAILAAGLVTISAIDLRSFRIPDALSLPLIALGLITMWWIPQISPVQTVFADHLIGASVAFLLFAGLGEVIFRRTGYEALGLGDAKLFAAAGAWLGWQALPTVLMIASLGALGFTLVLRRLRGAVPVAFGPWISLGFIVVWLAPSLR